MPEPSPSSSAGVRDDRRPAEQLGFDALGTPLFEVTFVVLDLETTGLAPSADRITEIGAVKVRGGEVLGELRTFVHPGIAVPPAVTAITGITDAMVADAPRIEGVIDRLLGFLSDSVFVAHNARFDLSFLQAAATRTHREPPRPTVVDTARLSRRLLADEVRDHRLSTLARHLRARTSPSHRALADARATVDVLHGLLERAGTLGVVTLDDLVELTRSRSDRTYRRRSLVADAPRTCGVYRFLDADGRTLYVGKATDLRARLRTYFGQDQRRRTADLVRETARVTWEVTPTLLEAEVRELRAIRADQPRYNRRSRTRRPERMLAITREPFPRLAVVRRPSDGHLDAFGPLASARAAEQLREAILEVFPLRACTPRLRRRQDHPPCVLKDLGRCGGPCDGTQSEGDYAEVVRAVAELASDASPLLSRLTERMDTHAAHGRYERAGELRELLHGAARALQATRQRSMLAAAEQLVLAREDGEGHELVVLGHGSLITTHRTSAPAGQQPLTGILGTGLDADPATPTDAEELRLILAWMAAGNVRLLESSQPLMNHLAGGAILAGVVEQARRTERALRRDQQVLTGSKVRRHPVDHGRSGDP
ncbi:MAG: DEDD exonuclease domain-containing protein [Nitriliruptoraceae bacterium]